MRPSLPGRAVAMGAVAGDVGLFCARDVVAQQEAKARRSAGQVFGNLACAPLHAVV
jgi:hypothetical protein